MKRKKSNSPSGFFLTKRRRGMLSRRFISTRRVLLIFFARGKRWRAYSRRKIISYCRRPAEFFATIVSFRGVRAHTKRKAGEIIIRRKKKTKRKKNETNKSTHTRNSARTAAAAAATKGFSTSSTPPPRRPVGVHGRPGRRPITQRLATPTEVRAPGSHLSGGSVTRRERRAQIDSTGRADAAASRKLTRSKFDRK